MIDIKGLDLEKIKEFLKDERKRSYAILGAGVAVSFLYLMLFIIPAYSEMSRLSRKVSEISEKIDFTNRTVVKMAQREEALERLSSELESYAGGFPREKEISRFLEKISTTAKDKGVKISTINPSQLSPIKTSKDKVYYYELPISVKAKSGYHELASFISEVEGGKRYLDVQGLKLEYNRSTPRRHDIRILIKTYVAGEGESS